MLVLSGKQTLKVINEQISSGALMGGAGIRCIDF